MMRKIAIFTIAVCCAAAFAGAQNGNRFVFTQMKYSGKWDPYPEVWRDILEFVAVTTSIKAEYSRKIITAGEPALFASPFIVVAGTEKFPDLGERERSALRSYLVNGGLMFVEDSSASRSGSFDSSFKKEIALLFPETSLKKLPMNHPLFRSYYLLRKIGGRRITNNYLEGIEAGGRTVIVYSQNDLLGAWAKDRFGNYLWECAPGGQDQRFEAQKLTLNLIMYSVTGTYKSDAIHKPYIQRKLGR
ncbi:MAG: DUF4159 domain-containing protein [Endomicrobiales bacterium]|nr:DUF4159 domain-containing protein [Endomicrobiales bacterium]